jgi:PAS domain S-box-containing protein
MSFAFSMTSDARQPLTKLRQSSRSAERRALVASGIGILKWSRDGGFIGCANAMRHLGYEVLPNVDDYRLDFRNLEATLGREDAKRLQDLLETADRGDTFTLTTTALQIEVEMDMDVRTSMRATCYLVPTLPLQNHVADAASALVGLIGANGVVRACNAPFRRFFELQVGMRIEQSPRRDAIGDMTLRLAAAIKGLSGPYERDYAMADGDTMTLLWRDTRMVTSDGEVCMLATGTDVTAMADLSRRVQERERILVEAERLCKVGHWTYVEGDEQPTFSDSHAEMFHWNGGHNPLSLVRNDAGYRASDDENARLWSLMQAGKAFETLLILQRGNDDQKVIAIRCSEARKGTDGRRRWIAATQDVTEEEANRQMLEEFGLRNGMLAFAFEKSQKAKALLESSDSGLRVVYVNESFAELLAYDRKQGSGDVLSALAGEDGEAKLAALIAEPMEKDGRTDKWTVRRMDGRTVFAEISAKAVPMDGRATILLTVSDLSRQAELETEQLRQRQLEALGRLASGIAHEVNNRLQPILSEAGKGLSDFPAGHPARTKFEKIHGQVKGLVGMLRDALSFARPGQERRERIEIANVLTNAINVVQAELPQWAEIRSKIHAKEIFIRNASHHDVYLLSKNLSRFLISDLMEQDGQEKATIVFTMDTKYLSREEAEITGIRNSSRCTRIMITCDKPMRAGRNISDDIFQPFYSDEHFNEGVGLDLVSVFGRIRMWGGHISVRTTQGSGPTFTILAPIATEL